MLNNIKNEPKIFKITFIVSIILFISKILGFVRESLIAAYYGSNGETDAFFFALSMPGMIFPAICSSLSIAFTSLYADIYAKDHKRGDIFACKVISFAFFIGICLSLFGIIASPYLVPILAPGFTGKQLCLTIDLTRIVMSSFFLTMLCYFLQAVLNTKKKFIGPQISSVVHNITIVVLILGFGYKANIEILTISVIFGLLAQVLYLFFYIIKYIKIKVYFSIEYSIIKNLFILSSPIILGNCITQINTVIDKALSSTLPNGSVSSLSYSTSLYTVITSVFIMSLSTVLFPSLIEDLSLGKIERFSRTLKESILSMSMILLYISFFTMINAELIVRIVFERGSFDQTAVKMTSDALKYYAPCLLFYGIRETISKAFYAMKDSKTPMLNSTIGVLINVIVSLSLIDILQIKGIALGTTISAFVTSLLLLLKINQKFNVLEYDLWIQNLIKYTISGVFIWLEIIVINDCCFYFNEYVLFITHFAVTSISYIFILTLLNDAVAKNIFHVAKNLFLVFKE